MTNVEKKLKIVIIGGGVVGLVLAIALEKLRLDIDYHLYETRDTIADVGASLTFSGYATETLHKLGLKPLLDRIGAAFRETKFRDWQTAETLIEGFNRKPATSVHRNEFVKNLFNYLPKERIHLGQRFKSYKQNSNGIQVEFENGSIISTDILVGADGIHSKIRSQVVNDLSDKPIFSGYVMHRGILDVTTLKRPVNYELSNVLFSFSPDHRSLVNIPIRQFKYYSLSATFPYNESESSGKSHKDLWHIDVPLERVVKKLEGFSDEFVTLYDSLKWINGYGLFYTKRLSSWTDGNVVLVGDSAHAMLPHVGQGGSTGIEDAFALAKTLETALLIEPNNESLAGNLSKWLKIYEKMRLPVANNVHLEAEISGDIMHRLHATDIGLKIQSSRFYPNDVHVFQDYGKEIRPLVYDTFGADYFFKLVG